MNKNSAEQSTFRTGWVYVLTHHALSDIVKIGFTERTVEERIKELEDSTGVPRGFNIVFCILVSNPAELEKSAHRKLSQYRLSHDREFFKIPAATAAKAITTVAQENSHLVLHTVVSKEFMTQQKESLSTSRLDRLFAESVAISMAQHCGSKTIPRMDVSKLSSFAIRNRPSFTENCLICAWPIQISCGTFGTISCPKCARTYTI